MRISTEFVAVGHSGDDNFRFGRMIGYRLRGGTPVDQQRPAQRSEHVGRDASKYQTLYRAQIPATHHDENRLLASLGGLNDHRRRVSSNHFGLQTPAQLLRQLSGQILKIFLRPAQRFADRRPVRVGPSCRFALPKTRDPASSSSLPNSLSRHLGEYSPEVHRLTSRWRSTPYGPSAARQLSPKQLLSPCRREPSPLGGAPSS
jgi:hypothetical protein